MFDISTIRHYLETEGSVYDLAELTGVPRSTIQSWLDNDVPKNVLAFQRVISMCQMLAAKRDKLRKDYT